MRAQRLDAAIRLPANPLAAPDLAHAQRHEIVVRGGMMGDMSGIASDWMFHCHVLDHQSSSMAVCLRVT